MIILSLAIGTGLSPRTPFFGSSEAVYLNRAPSPPLPAMRAGLGLEPRTSATPPSFSLADAPGSQAHIQALALKGPRHFRFAGPACWTTRRSIAWTLRRARTAHLYETVEFHGSIFSIHFSLSGAFGRRCSFARHAPDSPPSHGSP